MKKGRRRRFIREDEDEVGAYEFASGTNDFIASKLGADTCLYLIGPHSPTCSVALACQLPIDNIKVFYRDSIIFYYSIIS